MRANWDRHLEPHAVQNTVVAFVATDPFWALHDAAPEALTVETNIKLVRFGGDPLKPTGHSAFLGPHLEDVVTVGGEVIAKSRAAT